MRHGLFWNVAGFIEVGIVDTGRGNPLVAACNRFSQTLSSASGMPATLRVRGTIWMVSWLPSTGVDPRPAELGCARSATAFQLGGKRPL